MRSFYLVYMSSNVSLIFGEKNREKILAAKKLFLDQHKWQKNAIFFYKNFEYSVFSSSWHNLWTKTNLPINGIQFLKEK